MSETYAPAVGDRVKFLGVNADTPERKAAEITGTEGAWALLSPGAIGTVDEVVNEYEGDPRVFVIFDEVEMPMAGLARLLGQTTGWPMLTSELESLGAAA